MVQQAGTGALSLALSVGGVVASSLPSSLKRTTREIDALGAKAAEDRAELRRLSAELRGLERGTEEYNRTAARADELRTSLGETSAAQRELITAQRDAQAAGAQNAENMQRVAFAGAIAAGAILGAVTAVTSMSNRLREYSALAALSSRTTRELDRAARQLGITLGDASLGAAVITSLEELNLQGRAFQANFGTAGIAGIDVAALQRGELGLSDIATVLRDINDETDSFRRAQRGIALRELVGPAVLQAASELNDVSDSTLVLRRNLTQLGDTGLEVRDNLARGFLPVLTPLAMGVGAVAEGFGAISGPGRGAITVISGLAIGLGVLSLGIQVATFAFGGLSTAYRIVTTETIRQALAQRFSNLHLTIGSRATLVYRGALAGLATAKGVVTGATTAGTVAQARSNVVSAVGSTTSRAQAVGETVLAGAIGLKTLALNSSVAGWIAATVAAIGFNVATGGILIGIGLLVTGIILLVRNWDTVTSAVGRFGSRVQDTFNNIPGPIKTVVSVLFPIIGIVRLIASNFQRLRGIAQTVFRAIGVVVRPIAELIGGIASAFGAIGRVFGFGGIAPASTTSTTQDSQTTGGRVEAGTRIDTLDVDRTPLPVDRRPLPVDEGQVRVELTRDARQAERRTSLEPDRGPVTVAPVQSALEPIAQVTQFRPPTTETRQASDVVERAAISGLTPEQRYIAYEETEAQRIRRYVQRDVQPQVSPQIATPVAVESPIEARQDPRTVISRPVAMPTPERSIVNVPAPIVNVAPTPVQVTQGDTTVIPGPAIPAPIVNVAPTPTIATPNIVMQTPAIPSISAPQVTVTPTPVEAPRAAVQAPAVQSPPRIPEIALRPPVEPSERRSDAPPAVTREISNEFTINGAQNPTETAREVIRLMERDDDDDGAA